jgi:hypothetical protein
LQSGFERFRLLREIFANSRFATILPKCNRSSNVAGFTQSFARLLSSMSRSNKQPRHLSALLQHENSNKIARHCATTKGHTVVCPLVMERAIAYLRVSTQRQHRSGLGLEAQRTTIERFAANESLTIMAEYVEAETGKGSDALDRRPRLAAALAAAKAAKCSVVVCQARPAVA